MRFHPSLTTLCLAVALMAGGLGTHAMASDHDESSSDESQDSAQQGSQALDDAALQEKYGITPGALKRDEPASEDGNEGQVSSDVRQASEQDSAQEAERDGMEEQEGDAGDAVTDDTEAEEDDEGIDQTEKEMPTN